MKGRLRSSSIPRKHSKTITSAERIRQEGNRSGRWIASDALRELQSEAVQNRLLKKKS